jgi:hypothetical protein
MSSHGAATRSALGAAVRRVLLVLIHRCTQQRRAPRASAARNARRTRQRGAQVARQRAARRELNQRV